MRRHLLLYCCCSVIIVFGLPWQAAAQQADAFMLVPGIPGESTQEQHRNWISAYSVTQSFDAALRATNACTAVVNKGFDKAGPPLWLAAVTGQRFDTIRIDVVRSGAEPFRFYELQILNARILTISSAPNNFSETLTVGGDTAILTYYPQGPDGQPMTPVVANVTCK